MLMFGYGCCLDVCYFNSVACVWPSYYCLFTIWIVLFMFYFIVILSVLLPLFGLLVVFVCWYCIAVICLCLFCWFKLVWDLFVNCCIRLGGGLRFVCCLICCALIVLGCIGFLYCWMLCVWVINFALHVFGFCLFWRWWTCNY